MTDLVALLQSIVGPTHVRAGDAINDDDTHDEGLTGRPVVPLAVVRPASTGEVSRIITVADGAGVPVVARGSGTGLSGAARPVPEGIVVAFDRMSRILEVDEQNHVAVVQPGVTLAQLDDALRPTGLVYPVYPGEMGGSLGGNVATNAGGMRAVRYGVTRQHVLGLELVLADGQILRTGGKYVKSSSGYDLTQLVIGSEGTLALVTEVTVKLAPRLAHTATLLAPFASLAAVAAAVGPIVRSGVAPLILEYLDAVAMDGITRAADLDLGVADAVRTAAVAYLVVVLESADAARLDADVETAAALVADLDALEVYVLPPTAGAELVTARERAFYVSKAAGADDILDTVVPRAAVPTFLAQAAELAAEHGTLVSGCGHVGDGNVHLSVFQPDPARRRSFLRAVFAAAKECGGAVSGEHGIGTDKREYFLDLEDPAKVALMQRIKAAFDPHGILGPGRIFGDPVADAPGDDHGDDPMNGAEALLRSLVASGVDACFANPGTSEMQFVAALDRVPAMRPVPTLFEGVATGAADGYARIAGRPAATLLHLGPGFANGMANLHNARRAQVPLVNVVGDHATYHQRFDARLQSDLWGMAKTTSAWQRSSTRASDAGADAADAVAASHGPPGCIATLIVPADVSWDEGGEPAAPRPRAPLPLVPPGVVEHIAKIMRSGAPVALLIGGGAMSERGLRAADQVARATGVKLLCETFPTVHARGGGLPEPEKMAYYGEMGTAQLAGRRHLVLAGARSPVSFFAYPGKPGDLVPPDCTVEPLAVPGYDVATALEQLADAVAGTGTGRRDGANGQRPERPSGALTTETLAAAVGHVLPEGAIVVDESITSGLSVPAATAHGPRHDWLALAGGSIGQGLPVATGAAVAAPDRPVLCLEADGSAMYTIQSLWTQVREGLDVTTIVLANRSYAILQLELARVGASGDGERANAMLDLHRPALDFVDIATGLGMPASRAHTADELADLLERSLATEGPSLVEAVLAP